MKTDEYGKYTLSDQGKDALISVQTVEKTAKSETKQNHKVHIPRKNIVLLAAIALAILLIVSSTFAVVENAALGNQIARAKSGDFFNS